MRHRRRPRGPMRGRRRLRCPMRGRRRRNVFGRRAGIRV